MIKVGNNILNKIVVVGAAGHVGFPLALLACSMGRYVYGLDIDETKCKLLNHGRLLYKEEGAQELLQKCLDSKRLEFGTDVKQLSQADFVVIIIGTPLDAEGNANTKPLYDFVENTLIPNLTWGIKNYVPTIILRSTVTPGTTENIKKLIEEKTQYKEGYNFYLSYAPERCSEGHSLDESVNIPQIIGSFPSVNFDYSFEHSGYNNTVEFFSFNKKEKIYLSVREAEYAKLFTNMYRYVNFALANEFYMLSLKDKINLDKVTQAINWDYPRMSLAKPGFAAGPCLYKDGKFLLTDTPYNELIQNAFTINEGLPQAIFSEILKYHMDKIPKNIAILGMTFKADSDDTRNSLSFKMKKICEKNGINVTCYDPFLPYASNNAWFDQERNWKNMDAIILMTPHTEFKNILENEILKEARPNCVVADIWKFWYKSKYTKTGIYKVNNIV